MAVPNSTHRVDYNGDGSTTEFAVPFYFLANADVTVTHVSSAGTETVWTEGSEYTLAGAGDENGGLLTASTAPSSGTRLVIRREVAQTQEIKYPANDPFPSSSHEQALDKLTMIDQEQQEQIDRSLKRPVGDPTDAEMTLPTKADRASKVLGFDSSGLPVALSQLDKSADTVTALGSTTPRSLAEHLARLPDVVATGATTARSLADRLGDVLTPEDFGAVGEDADADTAAIRAALAALPEGGTLRLKDGRTYYCQASATRLEQHWNLRPRLYVADNSSFSEGETITGQSSATVAVVTGVDSGGSLLGLKDMQGSGFTNGEAITGDQSGSSVATADVELSNAGITAPRYTHAAFELTKPVTIAGRGTLKLVAGGMGTEAMPHVFANKSTNPIDGVRFRDFTLDMDATGNAGSGQPRGILLLGCSNVEIEASVTFTSSSARGGYAVSLYGCSDPVVNPRIRNVSGGVLFSYCDNLTCVLDADGFNEAVDIDKVCNGAYLGGLFRNGATGSGQVWDINSSTNVMIGDALVRDCGIVVFFNGKGNIPGTYENFLKGIELGFHRASGLTIGDGFKADNCNYSPGSACLSIGDDWAAAPHPNFRPVDKIHIGGIWTECGFMRVRESDGITFNCELVDILSPTTGNFGAVTATSENDWATYPDAEDWSDLKISFGPGFKVRGCNRKAIDVAWASECNIQGTLIRGFGTHGTTTDPAIAVRNIDVRDTQGIVAGNDINCDNGATQHRGINFVGDGTGAPAITVGPNRIVGYSSSLPYVLSGTVTHGLRGTKGTQRLGALATTDYVVLSAPPGTGYVVFGASWTDEAGVAANNTDYSAVQVRRLNASGSADGNIFSLTNQSEAFTAAVAKDLGSPTSTFWVVSPGESVAARSLVAGGTGASFEGTLTLQYLEWTE